MSFLTASPADVERRRGLRRMRIVATSALGFAAVIFLLTLNLDHDGAWGYVNTGAEAAMVGALADWFAVTALFKHPLGIPIPHTALVKRRKAELGRSLEEFVTENFMTESIARERLAAAGVSHRLGVWLQGPVARERVLTEVVRLGRAGLNRLDDDEIREFLEGFVLPRLQREPIAPIAGSLLDGIVADRVHHGLVDLGVEHLHRWLEEHPGVFAALLGERAPWWSPPWLDEKVIGWSYGQVLAWLNDIRTSSHHPARLALDALLRRLAMDLQTDPEVMARAETLKTRVLSHPQTAETAMSLWASFRSTLLSAMEDRSSYFHVRGDILLQHLSDRLLTDEGLRERLEAHLGDLVAFVVNTYGEELATVISHTVEQWDADEASRRIELFVGRDLQFIRINGTVVGALAGLVIHAVSRLVG